MKYRDKWAELGWCLWEGLSVRDSAQLLGVHPSTAFRWRHRFLSALRASEKPRLTGVAEVTVVNLIAYRRRLMEWGRRFRGVAARYYHNYLAWFSFVEQACELRPEAGLWKLLSRIFAKLSVEQRVGWSETGGESCRLLPWPRVGGGLCAVGRRSGDNLTLLLRRTNRSRAQSAWVAISALRPPPGGGRRFRVRDGRRPRGCPEQGSGTGWSA